MTYDKDTEKIKVVWYTKSKSTTELSHNALIHFTQYGSYAFCGKKIATNGRWFIVCKESFFKSVNCEECLKYVEDNGILLPKDLPGYKE